MADCVGSCLLFMTKRLCWPVALACDASKFFAASAHHTHTRNETTHMTSVPLSFFVLLTYLRQHVTHDLPMLTVEVLRRLTLGTGCVFCRVLSTAPIIRSRPVRPTYLFFAPRVCRAPLACVVHLRGNQGNRPHLSSFGSMNDLLSKL